MQAVIAFNAADAFTRGSLRHPIVRAAFFASNADAHDSLHALSFLADQR